MEMARVRLTFGLFLHGAILDVFGQSHEDLVDVGSVLGGSLNVLETQAIGELEGVLGLNLAVGQIALISNQNSSHIFGRIALQLCQPLDHILECIFLRQVEHDNHTLASAVVRRCNRSEAFLACSIPQLKLHTSAFHVQESLFL